MLVKGAGGYGPLALCARLLADRGVRHRVVLGAACDKAVQCNPKHNTVTAVHRIALSNPLAGQQWWRGCHWTGFCDRPDVQRF